MRGRVVVVGVLIVGSTGPVTAARAETDIPGTDKLVCTYSGRTSNLDDVPGIQLSERLTAENGGTAEGDLQDDAGSVASAASPAPNRLLETGGYEFSNPPAFLGFPTQCLHVDLDGAAGLDPDGTDDTGLRPATVPSGSGSYSSLVCGTGRAQGVLDLALAGDREVGDVSVQYGAQFARGSGAMEVLAGTIQPVAGNPNGERDAGGGGAFHLEGVPSAGARTACLDSDATDFNALGSLSVESFGQGRGLPSRVPAADTLVCTLSGGTTNMTDMYGIEYSDATEGFVNFGWIYGSWHLHTAPPFLGIPSQCLHVDLDGANSLDPDRTDDTGVRVMSLDVDAGSFESPVCGTARFRAWGTTTMVLVGDGELTRLDITELEIDMVNLYGGVLLAPTAVASTNTANGTSRGAAGTGGIHFYPEPRNPGAFGCVTSDATDFDLAGAVSFQIAP